MRYSGSYTYYYYLKDHLGDVRMILDQNGNAQVWNNYYPFGEEMPGLNIVNAGPDNRYQFTSKELDPTTSLYYFGARYYSAWSVEDPASRGSRWMSVDPLAKKYPGWSPYNYAEDDPTGEVDPNGAGPQKKNGASASGNTMTVFVGATAQGSLFVVGTQITLGVAVDTKGHVAFVASKGAGAVSGLGGSVGGTIGVINKGVKALKGNSFDLSASGDAGLGGSLDLSVSPNKHTPTGLYLTVSAGADAQAGVLLTHTDVKILNGVTKSSKGSKDESAAPVQHPNHTFSSDATYTQKKPLP